MSWQSGDVSVDARRAAEAAAAAAGVPLKEWFAETVRAAIIRELGSLPAEEATPPRAAPEPREPEVRSEPVISRSTVVSRWAAERADEFPAPASLATEPLPAPPVVEAEPAAPEPVFAAVPAAPPSIMEPEPGPASPATIETEAPPSSPPIVEPESLDREPIATAPHGEPPPPVMPGAALDAAEIRARTPSLGIQRLADTGLSSWLASRIQGLSPASTARQTGDAHAPTARLVPGPSAAPPRQSLDLSPPDRTRVPPPAAPVPAAAVAEPAAPILPLSLPTGPMTPLSLASLRPSRVRSRRPSDIDAAVAVLAASVASQGVREPILVRRLGEKADQYEVIAGERRRLAAERAGHAKVPAVVVTADDAEALMLSLAENLGRGDFSPLDESRAYLRLLTEYRVSPSALAQRLARERSHIALALRLLGLPPKVRQLVDAGRLAPAQAYSLLGAPDPEQMADQMVQAGAAAATGTSPDRL